MKYIHVERIIAPVAFAAILVLSMNIIHEGTVSESFYQTVLGMVLLTVTLVTMPPVIMSVYSKRE